MYMLKDTASFQGVSCQIYVNTKIKVCLQQQYVIWRLMVQSIKTTQMKTLHAGCISDMKDWGECPRLGWPGD